MVGFDSALKVVADVASLRASGRLSKNVIYCVLSSHDFYKYDSASASADDGEQFIKPAKISGNGRFSRIGGSRLIEPGQKDMNILRVASNVADAETVTIGPDVYEFKTSGNPVAGHIKVDVSGGVTPTLATTALAAAILASGTAAIIATRISANEILIESTFVGVPALACSTTMGGANNAWAAAATYGGRLAGNRKVSVQARVPKATEVALATMHFCFDFTPSAVIVRVFTTATPGVAVAFDGAIAINAGHVDITDNGAVHLATSQTVEVIALA